MNCLDLLLPAGFKLLGISLSMLDQNRMPQFARDYNRYNVKPIRRVFVAFVTKIARQVFLFGQIVASKGGLLIVPNHFYAPVADINELRRTQKFWAVRSPLSGICIDLERQAERLRDMVGKFEPEYRGATVFLEGQRGGYGPGFGFIEAQCLHGVIRSQKPRRVIEIGSGVSTHCATHALKMNEREGRPGSITCIEPFPSAYLRNSTSVTLITKKIQEVELEIFDELGSGDLLFIDTSHAVKPGGDVSFIYLFIIPRLKPGVIIHIHDIFFPYLYQRDIFDTLYQWSETAMLAALLTNNAQLKIIFCLSMLHYDMSTALRAVFPEYRPASDDCGIASRGADGHFPSSIYLVTS